MTQEVTYLELSEGNSHKFYEVTLNDAQVSIRFGRIGDPGQMQTSSYATPEKAQAEAKKKINEKIRKGYEPAVRGVRQKRAVTRRSSLLDAYAAPAPHPSGARGGRRAAASASPTNRAPVLWKFDSGACAFGIFVSDEACWVGNESGHIYALRHDGSVDVKFRLPDGVKCIVADHDWLYAGCDDGNVYDLGGKAPRRAYHIADNIDIFWLDIFDGVLAVSDDKGAITVINHEDESQWTKHSSGDRGWMARCDEIGVYHGHSKGVTMYDWEDGSQIWHRPTQGEVLFGWQEEATVYACTAHAVIHSFTKKGDPGPIYQCDSAIFSCAAAPDGRLVFAGDNGGAIYCFAETGERLWKLASGCGAALSMQYHRERLYVVTRHGALACIDAGESAVAAAQQGSVPQTVAFHMPNIVETEIATTVEMTSDASQGVIVECVREGGELRVRVVSEGYHQNWNCQFPKDIRQAGARYVVDEVREAGRGGFYRVYGDIRRLL
jgi:outer membrane protein assembly factor BamB/predicted DNA-binding WGR domain protein